MTNIEKLASLYIKNINEKYELELIRSKISIGKLKEWTEKSEFSELSEIISDHYWNLFNRIL